VPLLPREGVVAIKGLDYFRVQSDIAFDDDLEHVSDAAFRTFIELIGIAAHDLSDGRVLNERAAKLCNTADVFAAISELKQAQLLRWNTKEVVIKQFTKYQKSRSEVRDMREKNTEHVRTYREKRKDLLSPESGEQSKSKSISIYGSIVAAKPVDNLVELATTELPPSQSTPEDYKRTIDRYRSKLNDEHIERIICQLGAWKGAVDKVKLHLTLASWLNKEPRDPLPQAHEPFLPTDDETLRKLEEMAGLVKDIP